MIAAARLGIVILGAFRQVYPLSKGEQEELIETPSDHKSEAKSTPVIGIGFACDRRYYRYPDSRGTHRALGNLLRHCIRRSRFGPNQFDSDGPAGAVCECGHHPVQ